MIMAESASVIIDGDNDETDKVRKESKEIRSKIQALKKSVSKGDKKRKKEVTLEIAKLEAELEKLKHQNDSSKAKNETSLPETDVGMVTGSAQDELRLNDSTSRKSRSQKQREKKLRKEEERERRIAESEVKESETERHIERSKLLSLLEPLGLIIKDIKPDGNCLYAAISDQLNTVYNKDLNVQELRTQCSSYIRSNSESFTHFIASTEDNDISCSTSELTEYCNNIELTNQWGGEIELVALSHVHQLPMTIHQAEAPPILIGGEYSDNKMIHLSFHQHEFNLGRHYNSVINKTSD